MSAIEDLALELAKLPGIGRKTAMRLTYHLLKQPPEASKRLAGALATLVDRVHACATCGNLTEHPTCAICTDPRRESTVLCVVEDASDIGAIERSGEFRGRYHVLGGRLSPLDGVGPDDLNVPPLLDRVAAGGITEVIVATNPSLEGDATAVYLQRELLASGVRVTRIARGLPVGGDLEYADQVTIAQAMSARRVMA